MSDTTFSLDDPASRAFRAKLRSLVEEYANTRQPEGVLIHWALVAEFTMQGDAGPEGTFWMDYADFNDYGSLPWTVKGLLTQALDELRTEA